MTPTLDAPTLDELDRLIGCQTPLDAFHGCVRRSIQAIPSVQGYGVVLVTCSDEFQGEIRSAFERDVSRPLMSPSATGSRRTFAVSNMGGRIEPGALKLAEEHYRLKSGGTKLLLVEITAHCGVLSRSHEKHYGKLERFGHESDCCGALGLLVANDSSAAAVRHPWFDQLTAFFGPERLALLRSDESRTRMLTAAILHALLQGESAIADLLREPPPQPTHVLMVCAVVLNQPGMDDVIPVALHHLYSDGRRTSVVHGTALRSSPRSLRYQDRGGRLRVTCDESMESSAPIRSLAPADADVLRTMRQLQESADSAARARAALVREQVERAREHVRHLQDDPQIWRVHARPLLRGVIHGLSLVAPDAAIAALLVIGSDDPVRMARLKLLLLTAPTGDEARAALKQIEAEIQQLGHAAAQRALEVLVADKSPLLGG